MRKETYYFSHDFGARNDPKLQEVLMEHGVAGLGIFWCVIEHLYEQCGKMPLRSIKAIAFGLHTDVKAVESVVKDFGLFKYDDECFWSESVLGRLKKRDDANESRRQKRLAYLRKKKESQLEVNLKTTPSQPQDDTIIKEKESKGKESKEKDTSTDVDAELNNQEENKTKEEIKEQPPSPRKKSATQFKPPTIEEVRSYIAERNSNVDPETFWNFYEAKGWMIGRNKMKDWKACVRTWKNKDRQNERIKITQGNGVPRASYGRIGPSGQEHR